MSRHATYFILYISYFIFLFGRVPQERVGLSVSIFLLRAAKRIFTTIPHAAFDHQFPSFGGVADRPGWFLRSVATIPRLVDAILLATFKLRIAPPNLQSSFSRHEKSNRMIVTTPMNVLRTSLIEHSIPLIEHSMPLIEHPIP